MTATIRHKKDFQTYMFRMVRKSERTVLEQCSLEDRLSKIVRVCEWNTRGVYENDLPFEYNQVSYGLLWTVRRGTINGETYMSLKAMSFRELCGLVSTLKTECGTDITKYPGFLMRRYTTRIA